MFMTQLQNRKSPYSTPPTFNKKEDSIRNHPTIFEDGVSSNPNQPHVDPQHPQDSSDYDFITELLESKSLNYNNSAESSNFSLLKDSLTLISTKLNVIKEEDYSYSHIDNGKIINDFQISKSMLSIEKQLISEEFLDEDYFKFSTCPSSPCKVYSSSNIELDSKTSVLLLSCEISADTLAEKPSNLQKLKDMSDGQKDVLEKLLNMSDTVLSLDNKIPSDFLIEDLKEQTIDTVDILTISRSQQTINVDKNYIEINNKNSGSQAYTNKNITKSKTKSQANQTFDKVKKQSKYLIVPASKLNMSVKKQNVTNRGDFTNAINNKIINGLKAGDISRKHNIDNYGPSKKNKTVVTNRCFVYIPRVNLKNVPRRSKLHNGSKFKQKQELAIANMVIEIPKQKESNAYILSVKNNSRNKVNVHKNLHIGIPHICQSKRRIGIAERNQDLVNTELIDMSKRKLNRSQLSVFGPNTKLCTTDATTESVMKIVLKNHESKSDSCLGSNSCVVKSMTDINESDKSDSKVFAVDSSLFFNNAYKVFKEHKRSTIEEICKNKDESEAESQFLNQKFKLSSEKVKSLSFISSKNYIRDENNRLACEQIKSTIPSISNYRKIEKNKVSLHSRPSDIVTIYTKTSDEEKEIKPGDSSVEQSLSKTLNIVTVITDHDPNAQLKSRTYSIFNKTANSVPRITHKCRVDTKITKDANINTLITMKKNKEIFKIDENIYKNVSKDINKSENINRNVVNSLQCFNKSISSNIEKKSLSASSSLTCYGTKKKEGPVSEKELKKSSSELMYTRQYSSEEFIREISNTSNINNQSIDIYTKQFENNNGLDIVNEKVCNSLFENHDNFEPFTTVSPTPLSDVDSIETFTSKRLTSFESPKFCKKYTIYNTTENIIQRIKKLPFIGNECEWQRCTNDMWQFKLLNGRLFLIIRLDSRVEQMKVESERRILSIGLHKYVVHRKRNNLSAYCVKFVGDSIRFYIATKKWDRIGQIPRLLAKCCTIVRLGAKWEKDMRDTKIRIGYELDNNGLLTMQVANNTLNTIWDITMRVELQKDSYKSWSWPEVKDIQFKQVAGDRQFARNDLIAKLREISLDWDQVPKTLWTINDYLRHKKPGTFLKMTPFRCLHRSPIRKSLNADQHATVTHNSNVYQPRSRSPCPFTPTFIA